MRHLTDTFHNSRRWAKIVGIISLALFVFSFVNLYTQPTVATGIGYIIASFVSNFLPGLFLLRYAKAIDEADTAENPTEALEAACLNQGRYFKVLGIIMLLIIILAVVAFAFVMGSAMSMIR